MLRPSFYTVPGETDFVMLALPGGCRCGQVRYDCTEDSITSFICHCSGCLKRVGPYAGCMFVHRGAWTITGDYNTYRDVGGTGRALHMYACSQCGGYFGGWAEAVPLVGIILAQSLDDPTSFKPRFHNWVSSKPQWVTIADDLPQFMGTVDWEKLGGRPDFGTPRVQAASTQPV